MFDLYEKHRKEQYFRDCSLRRDKQEYAYIEDYFLYNRPSEKNNEEDENPRGIADIDLNNGKTIQIF